MAPLIRGFIVAIVLSSPFGSDAWAGDKRANVNYMIHCQGCHLPDASGVLDAVPAMNGFMGYFLHSQEGRDFLVRVPGVSTASLPDDEIAELLNWLLKTYSLEQAPAEFEPYTEAEVARLRTNPETDPETTRKIILDKIATELPALAEELASKQ